MKLIRSITLLVAIFLVLSVVGVYSTWNYARGSVPPIWEQLKLSVFPWTGSDILPEDDQIGQDHRSLIDAIINGPGIGLNTSKSYLNEQISSRRGIFNGGRRDTIGSVAVKQGDELNELFSLRSANLNFLIHFINDNTYEIFTTGVYMGERGTIDWLGRNDEPGKPTVALGEYIYPIYKTTAIKVNGTWTAQETALGSAKSDWYEESRSNEHATQIPSFDPDTWVEGERGANFDTAVWTFVGDSAIAIQNNPKTPLYYRIKPAEAGTRTVKVTDPKCYIRIYTSDHTLVASSTPYTENGATQTKVSWNASANTLYYISFEAVRNPAYTVS